MQFKTLSATALRRAIDCPASFQATHVDYVQSEQNNAAGLGTAVHDALEAFVHGAYVKGDQPATLERLALCYRESYVRAFGALDTSMPEWADGMSMLVKWFNRMGDFTKFKIVMLEEKRNFPVPLPDGTTVPFNYKFDRLDLLEEGVYRVVDYKTQRLNLNHDDLRKNLQARCYALAVMIYDKNAEKIWVQFDLLRHDAIGVTFTREDCKKTWDLIKGKAASLFHTEEPEEKLNSDCKYCLRKATCKTLLSNQLGGGIESIQTTAQLVDLRHNADARRMGLSYLVEEIDDRLMKAAEEEGKLVLSGFEAEAEITSARGSRSITDHSEVHRILGPELSGTSSRFSVTELDKLLKSSKLTEKQKNALKGLIRKEPGKIVIKTKRK